MEDRTEIEISVYLYDPESGKRAVYDCPGFIDEDGIFDKFIWEEGNFSCDCNKRIFMGIDEDDDECGETIIIEKITPKDEPDNILYSDKK